MSQPSTRDPSTPDPSTPDRPPARRAGGPSDAPEAQAPGPPGDGGEETITCAVCGKERPAGWQCGCGDAPGPMVPEGWDPAVTRGTGPRLPLTGRQGGRAG